MIMQEKQPELVALAEPQSETPPDIHARASLNGVESSIAPQLQQQLARLKPEEQTLLAHMIMRAKPDDNSAHQLDAISFIHPYLKAHPLHMDAPSQEEIQTIIAPPMVKTFADAKAVPLSRDYYPLDIRLDTALQIRSSSHDFSKELLSFQTLSSFLYHAYGVREQKRAYNVRHFPFRLAPSAGGLQPIDLYLVANQVESLDKGLYYYDPVQHALMLLDEGNMRYQVVRCAIFQDWVASAPVVLMAVCNMHRILWKYGVRGYRFAHIDTGVLTQNMYLVGTALGLNTCALAAYYDDRIHDLLGIDGRGEFVTLLFVIGDKPFSKAVAKERL